LLKADWFLLGTGAKINGTNSIVIRLVDARTGILRDAGVFSSDKPLAQLARDIAAFARQSRQNTASGKIPVFLAIGTFEDLSVNNRQAGFPAQLRGYLMAAYQASGVTLLEREYVDTLLQEVHLDLAGLTEESATNAPAPMQSAYWLVSGTYQSYETTNVEVEVALDVQRIFGLVKHVNLRGQPGEPVSRQIKQAIDGFMNPNQGLVVPTRTSEIIAQMSLGQELSEPKFLARSPQQESSYLVWPHFYDTQYFDGNGMLLPRESFKRRRNLEEAIRAFETVLLLDPGNGEAKMRLAACLRSPIIDRLDDARHCYREIIDAQVQDKWTKMAQTALGTSFEQNGLGSIDWAERARWFESAAEQSVDASKRDFYAKEANAARASEAQAAIKRAGGSEAQALAEGHIFEALQSYRNQLDRLKRKKGGTRSAPEFGVSLFLQTFGDDHAAAARRLVELLPKVRSQIPEAEPYFLATVVASQDDTNAPVVAEFQREFAQLSEHPDQVLDPRCYWMQAECVCQWGFQHKLYALAAQVLEGRLRNVPIDNPAFKDDHYVNEDRIKLAYAHLGLEHWQQARDIFETFSNRSFVMYDGGPWGPNRSMVLTGREAAYCAKKLGQTPARDAREFDMGRACFCLCTPSAWVLDEGGLWIGINNQLLYLDFDLKTNLAVNLPPGNGAPVACLCPTDAAVWIGTDGEGLIEYDKTSRQCRRMTEQDGLLMNNIACLNLAGASLWIGYGHRSYVYWAMGTSTHEGGLGRLDLSTRQFTSFTPSLEERRLARFKAADKPTHCPVIVLARGSEDDVWCVTETENSLTILRHFRPRDKVWEAGPQTSSSLAVDQKRLFLGQYWNYEGENEGDELGVKILDFKTGRWRSLKTSDGLPCGAVSAVASDGHDLWVGGRGYVALIDLEHDKIRKFARIKSDAVDQIQIGGGYLWALYDAHLHRALLQNVR
jgi:hypothetical protein